MSAAPAPGPHGPTILLADDEPDVLDALVSFIAAQEPHATVLTAVTSDQALALLGHTRVDAVVADQHLPGLPGLELLDRVRRLHPDARRVLMVTRGEALPPVAGLAAVLRKPFGAKELQRALGWGTAGVAGRLGHGAGMHLWLL